MRKLIALASLALAAAPAVTLTVAPVAALLKKQLEEREQLKLSTTLDDQIGFCDACGCPLKTKLHIPIEVIRKHMKQPEIDRLDARCWILKEP